jgi:hypothetical protein
MSTALGLRANLAQFSLLVGVNALVGGMLGQERTVLPLLGEQAFGLTDVTVTLRSSSRSGWSRRPRTSSPGLSDRHGRNPVLIAGWLAGLPVPL